MYVSFQLKVMVGPRERNARKFTSIRIKKTCNKIMFRDRGTCPLFRPPHPTYNYILYKIKTASEYLHTATCISWYAAFPTLFDAVQVYVPDDSHVTSCRLKFFPTATDSRIKLNLYMIIV